MSGQYKTKNFVAEVYDITELGGGLKLVKDDEVQFGHDEATALLELEEFSADRPLRQKHVDYLVQTMKRSTFHPEWVCIITCTFGGKEYRMNGQHTAWARLEMPKRWRCQVRKLEYSARTEDDMRRLYASIDRSSPRTRENVISSYLSGTEEFKKIRSNTLKIAPKGFSIWFWPTKTERSKYDGDDVAYLLRTEHYDLTIKVCAFLDRHVGRDQRFILRAPVIAAMFATFHKAPQIATTFWAPVVDGTGIDRRGDPRLKLRNELMHVAINLAAGARSDKKQVSQEVLFRNCLHAWNAFRENRSLQVLRGTDRGKRPRVK